MHVGEIGNEEVLVIADDSGHAAVHFPEDTASRAPLLFKLPMSAWGMDTHSMKRLVAISCNAYIVTLFHLGMGIEEWDWTTQTPFAGDTYPKLELKGHANNIPCVSFDRTGLYIVSGSLDTTVRLWDCATGQMLKVFDCEARYLFLNISFILIQGYGLSDLSIRLILSTTRAMRKVSTIRNQK